MDYSLQQQLEQNEKLMQLRNELPAFCGEFFRGVESTTMVHTRLAYATDLKIFFNYLKDARFCGKPVRSIAISDLNTVTLDDVECFLEYVNDYCSEAAAGEIERTNQENGKARKLAALRALFKYLYKKGKLDNNVAAMADSPRLHAKPKIRLEANEVADLLDSVESGDMLTGRQQKYHALTADRDLAMLSLFLGTGIRITELVGINLKDVDFASNAFKVTRKGGAKDILYFNDEVAQALKKYYDQRVKIEDVHPDSQDALFLSMQKRRITQRAIQNLVKKYSSAAVPLKTITPHKLRKTFGTMLYLETGDIYLVANALGHKDVNTTQKHYADTEETNKRYAARVIKLRS